MSKDKDWYGEFITKKEDKLFHELDKYICDKLDTHEISLNAAAAFYGKSLFSALQVAHHYSPPRDRDKFTELLKGMTAEIKYINSI